MILKCNHMFWHISYLIILLIFNISYMNALQITGVRHLTYSEGLSSHRIFSIIEDLNGAIWISTKSGIDRFNGREIKNYSLLGDFYYGDMAGRKIQLFSNKYGEIYAYYNTVRIYRYSAIYYKHHISQQIIIPN